MKKSYGVAAISAAFVLGFLTRGAVPGESVLQAQSGRVYELRTYTAPDGKLGELNARFRNHTMRIFRGSLPEGCGPFTKDLCYSKGFVMIYNYIRLAVSRGMVRRVPLLFCGKANLADIKTLAQLVDEGLVAPPRFLPPPFADLHALSAWMCFANFLGRLSLKRIEEDYACLF